MEPGPGVGSLAAWEVDGDTQGRRHLSHGVLAVARTSPRVLARFGPTTPTRARRLADASVDPTKERWTKVEMCVR